MARPAAQRLFDRMVLEGQPVLEAVARRVARRLGRRIPVEDLIALGRPALLEIARTFDPDRSSFSSYARRKLRWAIFDGIRRETRWRSVGARVCALSASARFGDAFAAEAASGRPEEEDDVHGTPPAEVFQARLGRLLAGHAAAMALGLATCEADPAALPDSGESPEEGAARSELAGAVRRAVGALPERERALIERHYFGGERFDQIAAELGISKSRASRLHAQGIERLGASLRPGIP